jgi:predicted metal-dependent hydrolase
MASPRGRFASENVLRSERFWPATDLDTIRVFAISKLGWIKQQQRKMNEQEREPPREYLDRESHYVWENAIS